MRTTAILLALIFLHIKTLSGQTAEDTLGIKEKFTPYELLSTYYETDFDPFEKKNIYLGMSFSLEDRQLENADQLFRKVLDGEQNSFNILIKGGYFLSDYNRVGLNLNYYERTFDGSVFRDPDTLQSNTITRGFEITPNFRTTVPLTKNERLSFFTSAGLTFGASNTLKRDVKNLDEIDKSFATDYNFRLGLSPGITFFVMENFGFEVQLDVLGYEVKVIDQTVNGEEESSEIRQNIDLNIDLLSLKLGLAYYINLKSKKR